MIPVACITSRRAPMWPKRKLTSVHDADCYSRCAGTIASTFWPSKPGIESMIWSIAWLCNRVAAEKKLETRELDRGKVVFFTETLRWCHPIVTILLIVSGISFQSSNVYFFLSVKETHGALYIIVSSSKMYLYMTTTTTEIILCERGVWHTTMLPSGRSLYRKTYPHIMYTNVVCCSIYISQCQFPDTMAKQWSLVLSIYCTPLGITAGK